MPGAGEQLSSNTFDTLLLAFDHDRIFQASERPALQLVEQLASVRGCCGTLQQSGRVNAMKQHQNSSRISSENAFLKALQREIEDNSFRAKEVAEISWRSLISLMDDIKQSCQFQEAKGSTEPLWQKCYVQGQDLIDLNGCVQSKSIMLAMIAEAWDTGISRQSLDLQIASGTWPTDQDQDSGYLACIQNCIMPESYLEPCIVILSDAYEQLRLLQNDETEANTQRAAWQPPSRFIRNTSKFWLKPKDVLEFKSKIVQHLPILIFDRNKPQAGCSMGSLASQQALRDCTILSSVYYDNDIMQSYTSRLLRDDRSTSTRIRFYGPRTRSASQQVFVERKMHREPWTGEQSCKERCAMRQMDILGFMSGEFIPDYVKPGTRDHSFLGEVQASIVAQSEEAVLRTVCARSAFQESSNDLVRISLDTNLHMMSELGAQRSDGDWCRDERSKPDADEILTFPYCVVEIKLRLEEPPEWLHELLASGVLIQAPRFSKYLHRAAGLFPDKVSKVPYWYLHNSDGSMSPATWEEMSDDRDEFYKQNSAPWMFPKQEELPFIARFGRFGEKAGQDRSDRGVPDPTVAGSIQTSENRRPLESTYGLGEELPSDSAKPLPQSSDIQRTVELPSTVSSTNDTASLQAIHGTDKTGDGMFQTPPLAEISEKITSENAPLDISPKRTRWWRRKIWLSSSRGQGSTALNDKAGTPVKKALQSSYRSKALVRSRVEPKTFFANERTFLAWLNISALIMLTGLSLLGGTFSSLSGSSACSVATPSRSESPASASQAAIAPSVSNTFNCRASQYAGLAISPVAVLFMIYALYMYKVRTIQIMQQRKSVRFDDQRGPILLVVLLVGALLTAMVFIARAALA